MKSHNRENYFSSLTQIKAFRSAQPNLAYGQEKNTDNNPAFYSVVSFVISQGLTKENKNEQIHVNQLNYN